MAARVAICLAALALGAFAVVRHHDVTSCSDALHAATGGDAAAAQGVREHCRGGEPLASAAAALATRAPRTARALADEATRRDPEDARAWLAVAFATRRDDPARARAAQARATQLNRFAPVVVAP